MAARAKSSKAPSAPRNHPEEIYTELARSNFNSLQLAHLVLDFACMQPILAGMSQTIQSQTTESLVIPAREAAKLLSVSERHLWTMNTTGQLGPRPIRFGRAVRWSRSELEMWAKAGCPDRAAWDRMKTGEVDACSIDKQVVDLAAWLNDVSATKSAKPSMPAA